MKNIVGMKDTSGDITQTEEFIRRNADVGLRYLAERTHCYMPAYVLEL